MPKIKILKITPNEFLETVRDASWDRPSAYWELCARAKLRGTVPELSMHAKDKKLGWEGDSAEALAHIEKHFGRKAVPILFTQTWDT